jgi:anti-anti-sigma regulatory factor
MGRHMAYKKRPSGGGGSRARSRQRPQAASSQSGTNSAATAPSAACAAAALPLGSSLSIREVGERAAQLKALFASGSAEVDARKLESIDTAGLQLLLAAAAAARRRGLTLKLLGAERLNSGAAGALGLAEYLAAAAQILP